MIQHAVQPADTRSGPVAKRLSVLVVLKTTFHGVENPGVVEWVGEDIDGECLEDGDWCLDVVCEIEDDEVRLLKSIRGCESDHDLTH